MGSVCLVMRGFVWRFNERYYVQEKTTLQFSVDNNNILFNWDAFCRKNYMALWLNKPFSSIFFFFLNGHYHCGVWEGLDVCSLTLITPTGFLHGIFKKIILFIQFACMFGLYNAVVIFIFSKYWSLNGFSHILVMRNFWQFE